MPELKKVDSSHITHLGYDAAKHELHVQFQNGDKWAYSGVRPDEFESVNGAASIGSAFHRIVKQGGKPATKIS